MISVDPLGPRSRRSTHIAESLRHLIASGQLKPGDKLPTETLLCQQFGVSRTTLREAIQMLRTTGLLDVTPGRGSFVRLPDVSQLMRDISLASRSATNPQDITALRLLLQRNVLLHLSRTQPSQRKDLFQHVLIRSAAPEENAHAECQWHLSMAEIAGNPMQKLLLECLLTLEEESRTQRYRDLDEVMRTIHIQMRTNAAIIDGDWPLAERVLCQFIAPDAARIPHPAQTREQNHQQAPLAATTA